MRPTHYIWVCTAWIARILVLWFLLYGVTYCVSRLIAFCYYLGSYLVWGAVWHWIKSLIDPLGLLQLLWQSWNDWSGEPASTEFSARQPQASELLQVQSCDALAHDDQLGQSRIGDTGFEESHGTNELAQTWIIH